jgi:group I intron endonuclease
MCVYTITNRVNGNRYVGVTSGNAGTRWSHHALSVRGDRGACPLVARAVAKHGLENFEFAVIDIAESREQLSHKEKFWIVELRTLAPNGYNLTTGGDANFEVTEEVREKLRTAAKNRSDEWRVKQSESRKVWWDANPEFRQIAADRARRTHFGKSRPQHVIDAVSAAHKGAVRTEVQKINSARAHMKGRIVCCSNGSTYQSSYEAALATGVDRDKIGSVCSGKRASTGGLRFWYEEAV